MADWLPKTAENVARLGICTMQNRRSRQKALSIAPSFGFKTGIFALFSLLFGRGFPCFHSSFCQKAIIWRGETDDFSGQK